MNPPARVKRPARKPKGRFHHGDLAEALVQAAAELVEKEGHAALSLRVLARRLGVTEPALYRHFASKDALLAEVGLRGLRSFLATMTEAIAAHTDPFAAAEAAGRAYVRGAHAHPGWFRLWFTRFGTERLAKLPHIQAASGAAGEPARAALLATITRILPPGARAAADVYRALWALAHGLAVFVVERVFQLVQTDTERIAAADEALAVFIASLRARYPARGHENDASG